MMGGLEMLAGVLVLRVVAAPYVTTSHAQAQVNPGITSL
jgi:hypothetical protein